MRPKYLEMHESDCPLKGIYCQDKDVIKVKVVGEDSGEVHYRIRETTKMAHLIKSYSFKIGFAGSGNVLDYRYIFDVRRICFDDTPLSLDMENDDVIEVYQAHVGS